MSRTTNQGTLLKEYVYDCGRLLAIVGVSLEGGGEGRGGREIEVVLA